MARIFRFEKLAISPGLINILRADFQFFITCFFCSYKISLGQKIISWQRVIAGSILTETGGHWRYHQLPIKQPSYNGICLDRQNFQAYELPPPSYECYLYAINQTTTRRGEREESGVGLNRFAQTGKVWPQHSLKISPKTSTSYIALSAKYCLQILYPFCPLNNNYLSFVLEYFSWLENWKPWAKRCQK